MADETTGYLRTPHADIVLYPNVEEKDGKMLSRLVNLDTQEKTNVYLPYAREKMEGWLNDPTTPDGKRFLKKIQPEVLDLSSEDHRNFVNRSLLPALHGFAPLLGGIPAEVALLATFVPNPQTLLEGGYLPGADYEALLKYEVGEKEQQELRDDIKKYGMRYEGMPKVMEPLYRAADDKWQDVLGHSFFDFIPDVLKRNWPLAPIPRDITPRRVTLPEKVVATTGELFAEAVGLKGMTGAGTAAGRLARRAPVSDELVSGLEKFHKAHKLGSEAKISGSMATFMESTEEGLDTHFPDLDPWARSVLTMGAAFIGPASTERGWTAFKSIPGVRKARRVVERKVIDPVVRPLRHASRFVEEQTFGKNIVERQPMLEMEDFLANAIANNRHIDEASGLAFTTPELLRSEANRIKGAVELAKQELAAKRILLQKNKVESQENLIAKYERQANDLNRQAKFYEDVLVVMSKPQQGGTKAEATSRRFFQSQAKHLEKRTQGFFNYVKNQFEKNIDEIDFNGKPGGSPAALDKDYALARERGETPVYEATRKRLVLEGDPSGVAGAELKFLNPQQANKVDTARDELSEEMQRNLQDHLGKAQERVDFWKKGVQEYIEEKGLKTIDDLTDDQKRWVGDLVRSKYDDTARIWRAFEKAAYGRVRNLDRKITDREIEFPEGSVDAKGNDISGMTVSDFASNELDNLSRQAQFNIKETPVQLAHLAGSRSVLRNITAKQAKQKGVQKAEARIFDIQEKLDSDVTKRTEVETQIDVQRRKDGLPADGTVTARLETGEAAPLSKELENLHKKREKIQDEIDKSEAQISKITGDYLGEPGGVALGPGRLSVFDETNGRLIGDGVAAQDVVSTISDITDAMASLPDRKGLRYKRLVELRNTLQQLVDDPRVFDLDPTELTFAKEVTTAKHRVLDAQGDVLRRRGAAVAEEAESLPSAVLPEETATAYKRRVPEVVLRKLRTATQDTPEYVSFKQKDGEIALDNEGIPIAIIDETRLDATKGFFAQAGSPFERVSPGGIQSGLGEIRLKPNALVSPETLELGENIILERLALTFPEGVDSKGLERFRQANKSAIKFLEDNDSMVVPNMIRDADEATARVKIYNDLIGDKTRATLNELVDSGQLSLGGLSVDDYVTYLGKRRVRSAQSHAFADVLDADPGRATEKLFDTILNPNNAQPRQNINEFLTIVGGNKAAEDGLKAAIFSEIFRRSTVKSPQMARELGDVTAKVFDPAKFSELISNERTRSLIREVFPDNPVLLEGLDIMSLSAFEASPIMKQLASGNFDASAALELEMWGNLGRMLGLGAADMIPFVNSLVAAGAGARYLTQAGRDITGNVIRDAVIDAALNPKTAALFMQTSNKAADPVFRETIYPWLVDSINLKKGFERVVTEAPGATSKAVLEIELDRREQEKARREERIKEYQEKIQSEKEDQSAAALTEEGPNYVMLREPPRSRPYAMLSAPRATAPTAQATATQAPVTPERLEQARLIDPAFFGNMYAAKNGGYIDAGAGSGMGRLERSKGIMSIKRKGRQLVG